MAVKVTEAPMGNDREGGVTLLTESPPLHGRNLFHFASHRKDGLLVWIRGFRRRDLVVYAGGWGRLGFSVLSLIGIYVCAGRWRRRGWVLCSGAESKVNHCAVQQSALVACEEMRGAFVSMAADRREPVFCPKPRRLSQLSGADPVRPLRWQLGHQADPCDSRPGADVLDIILAKGSHGGRADQHPGESPAVASSPPYFCGSPPSRATNPLVLDARFGDEKAAPLTPLPALAGPSPTAGGRQGRVRASFGPKPAAVRIEGFDCLNGDGRRSSCGITAVA